MTSPASSARPKLELLDLAVEHEFCEPVKEIHEGEDVSFFLTMKAYKDIVTFLMQLNTSMFPRRSSRKTSDQEFVQAWELGSRAVVFSPTVKNLGTLLARLNDIIGEAPPDSGPRRFGNISFRKWHGLLEDRIDKLLEEYLPVRVLKPGSTLEKGKRACDELRSYLLASFGSAQRLDYGTGHELAFLAFIGGIWKLRGFMIADDGVEERGIVLGVMHPYLQLVRRLIQTYNLEPAGSHGVWGLDDHSFLPYIFGSAQFAPAITDMAQIPADGSLSDAPDPGDVTVASIVARERDRNMYFEAIGFIYDVKKGPFWEHSPMLYDISGIKSGWAKINKGMLKMYNVEVLAKFPVVQHFRFGYLFQWVQEPNVKQVPISKHTASQPRQAVPSKPSQFPLPVQSQGQPTSAPEFIGTAAPWASGKSFMKDPESLPLLSLTKAPLPTRAPANGTSRLNNSALLGRALPAGANLSMTSVQAPLVASQLKPQIDEPTAVSPTRAQWARDA